MQKSFNEKIKVKPMNLWERLKIWFNLRKPRPIDYCYLIEFNDNKVVIRALPAGRPAWEQSFLWSSVTRVCMTYEVSCDSDVVYVFTSLRPESFVIPIDATGADEFVRELVSRNLFPVELIHKFANSTSNILYCWPSTKN